MELLIVFKNVVIEIKKIALACLSILVLASFAPLALATKPSVVDFEWWQFYDGWGPANHYGQNVLVHYTTENKWSLKITEIDGDYRIRQTLTQNGEAEVYDATTGVSFTDDFGIIGLKGDLIESGLNFRVVEVTHGIASYLAEWYDVYSLSYIEKEEYHWIIPGVYHYHASILDGLSSFIFEYWTKPSGWVTLSEG